MKKKYSIFITAIIVWVALFILSYIVPQITTFAFQVMLILLGYITFVVIDKYGIPEFDTFRQIANGNIAVAIYFLGICTLIAAATLAASAGFSLFNP